MQNNFLAIDKTYLGKGLKSIDILILAQIEEFQRNKCECYLTNEQFAIMFGESISTVKRSLDKLEEEEIILRQTRTVKGKGRANKERVLSIRKTNGELNSQCNVQKDECKVQNDKMEGSNSDNGRFKNNEWKVHNEPIKNNLKENKKENLKDNETKKEIANADGKTKNRTINDLTIDEGEAICKAIKNNTDKYANLQQKYGLKFGSVTKDFPKQWESEKNARSYMAAIKREEERRENESCIDYSRFDAPQKSQEEIEHDQMMEELLIYGLDDDEDQDRDIKRRDKLKQIKVESYCGTRLLGDLSDEENEEIAKEIIDGQLTIDEIGKKYGVKQGIITERFPRDWERSCRFKRKVKELEESGKSLDDIDWDELFPEDKDEDDGA